ncbi:hypothetical protein [Burkholderia gladioli]|uniref:hypothetical protein n=1 Tax=Burkholderia gladioli TaxID=28095 RepID=UPI002FE31A0F
MQQGDEQGSQPYQRQDRADRLAKAVNPTANPLNPSSPARAAPSTRAEARSLLDRFVGSGNAAPRRSQAREARASAHRAAASALAAAKPDISTILAKTCV